MSANIKETIKGIGELLLPTQKFSKIARFIKALESNDVNLIQAKIEEEKAKDPDFEGVARVEHEKTADGRDVFIVALDEEYFPPGLAGPGMASLTLGVAFICNGFSDSAHKMIRDHELYHLQHGPQSISHMPVIRHIPGLSGAHEVETFLAANLFKDPIGTARAGIEMISKTPKVIIRYIKNCREQIKKIIDLG